MKKRYLFFDIDGTLLAGGFTASYLPESTKLALEKLKEAGHFLAIATGRSQAMSVDIMHSLGFVNMVHDGGWGITINDQMLGIRPLDKEPVVKLIHECDEKGFAWGLQIDNSKYRSTPDERFKEFTYDGYMECRIIPGLKPENCENIYKAYIACDYPHEFELENLKNVPWCRFSKNYFFVEPTDKAYGIKKIMDYFKAPYEDAIVFGDQNNDLSMFTDDWYKVAMGNGTDELKAKADFVTKNVDDGGIYYACEQLGLFL